MTNRHADPGDLHQHDPAGSERLSAMAMHCTIKSDVMLKHSNAHTRKRGTLRCRVTPGPAVHQRSCRHCLGEAARVLQSRLSQLPVEMTTCGGAPSRAAWHGVDWHRLHESTEGLLQTQLRARERKLLRIASSSPCPHDPSDSAMRNAMQSSHRGTLALSCMLLLRAAS